MKKLFLKGMLPVLFAAALAVTGCKPDDKPKVGDIDWTDAAMIVGNCKSTGSEPYLSNALGAATLVSADDIAEAGNSIVALRVDVGPEVAGCKAFIAEGDPDNVVAEKEFTPNELGWTYVKFDAPFPCKSGVDYFIGYTCTSSSSGDFPMRGFPATRTYDTEYAKEQSKWMKLKEANIGGRFAIQAVVSGRENYSSEEDPVDVAVVALADAMVVEGQPNVAKVAVMNVGVCKIASATLTVTGASKTEKSVSGPILPGQTSVVTVDIPTPAAGEYKKPFDVKISALAPEGKGANGSRNNKAEFVQQVYKPSDAKRNAAVIEQFTSVDCGYCPMGERNLQAVIGELADPSKVIWIANHGHMGAVDPLVIDESEQLQGYLGINAFPMMVLNRTVCSRGFQFNPSNVSAADMATGIGQPTVASLTLERTFDASTRELKVTVSGNVSYSGAIKVSAFVMQNGLVARQTDYQMGTTYPEKKHNNVPRLYLTGAIGDALTVAADGNYKWEKTVTVPESVGGYDCEAEKMNVVAYISLDGKTVYDVDILNAMKLPLVEGTNPDAETEEPEAVAGAKALCAVPGAMLSAGE